jgi:hypothetical protein
MSASVAAPGRLSRFWIVSGTPASRAMIRHQRRQLRCVQGVPVNSHMMTGPLAGNCAR